MYDLKLMTIAISVRIGASGPERVHLTKQLMIAKYPVVLVLQICKTEETMYAADRKAFEKNINGVDFWEDFRGLKARTKEANDLKEALKHYRLFSVVEHIGSANSGHYICYVRRQDTQKWNRCDDSYVKEVKLQEVLKSDAYLLFYEKCETELH